MYLFNLQGDFGQPQKKKIFTYVGCSAINENGLVSPKVKIAWQR